MVSSDDSRRASYVNSGSVLLNDMIRERKAQAQRHTIGRGNGLDDRTIQSSPMTSAKVWDGSGVSSHRGSGTATRKGSGPKEMGLREMEEVHVFTPPLKRVVTESSHQHISQIKKQNWNLKLEIFHLREKNDQYEVKLANVAEIEADNTELQSINEELLLELEKKDKAIEEAVELICERERQIEEMEEADAYFMRNAKTQQLGLPSQGASSGPENLVNLSQPYAQNADAEIQAPPDVFASRVQTASASPSKSSRRVPSFLREPKKSTSMLRSLYQNDGSQSQGNRSSLSLARPGSLYSAEDDDEDRMLNSPRLSVLSESGFSSIYGGREQSNSPPQNLDSHVEERPLSSDGPSQSNQREIRLQKWLVGKDRPSTPAKQTLTGPFSSIGQVLEEAPIFNNTRDPKHQEEASREDRTPEKYLRKTSRAHQRKSSSPTFGGPIFGGSILPPTPDTLSTTTTAASSSTPSIVTDKSVLESAPYATRGYSTLIRDGRPHTSGSSNASTFGTALIYDRGAESSKSGEDQAPHNENQKNVSFGSHLRETPLPPPSRSSSSRSTTRPIRPSLTTAITDTICYTDGHSPSHGCRTLSYPSPGNRTRRPTNQLSPINSQGSDSHSEKTPTASSRSKTGTSNAAGTPERLARNMRQVSPMTHEVISTPTPMVDSHSEASPSPQRSSSLRSMMTSVSPSPSKTAHQSIASRLFRRANSQSTQASIGTQMNTPSKPSVAHARIPRPSSLYASGPSNGQKPLPSPSTDDDAIYESLTYDC